MKVCPVTSDFMDDTWNYIVFQFIMNYTEESIRHGYLEAKKKNADNADDELLAELGYSDEDILNKHDIT